MLSPEELFVPEVQRSFRIWEDGRGRSRSAGELGANADRPVERVPRVDLRARRCGQNEAVRPQRAIR
jgi:hypothetical protein